MDVLLVGRGVVGRHVLHQGRRTASVEEVDGDAGASAAVARQQTAVEVGKQVDLGSVELASGQDTGDGHADVGLRV